MTKGQQWLRSVPTGITGYTRNSFGQNLKMKKLGKISFNWRYKDQLLHLDDLAIYGLEFLHVFIRNV